VSVKARIVEITTVTADYENRETALQDYRDSSASAVSLIKYQELRNGEWITVHQKNAKTEL